MTTQHYNQISVDKGECQWPQAPNAIEINEHCGNHNSYGKVFKMTKNQALLTYGGRSSCCFILRLKLYICRVISSTPPK